MAKSNKLKIEGQEISIISVEQDDYISLTNIAKSQMQEAIIIKWLSLKSTIEYIGEWEALYNPYFNYTEFGTIKNSAGSNNFVLSVKNWIEATRAIGLSAKAGRYDFTAHLVHKKVMKIFANLNILLFLLIKSIDNFRIKQSYG